MLRGLVLAIALLAAGYLLRCGNVHVGNGGGPLVPIMCGLTAMVIAFTGIAAATFTRDPEGDEAF